MTDREKLIKELRWWADRCDRTNSGCQVRPLLEWAADKLESGVVREKGEWEIIQDYYDNELMRCPVCREEFCDGENDTVDHTPNFCPNCGADMRKGENDG